MIPLAITFVAVSLMFVGTPIPLMRRRVKANRHYGVRIGATFADETVWYETMSGADATCSPVESRSRCWPQGCHWCHWCPVSRKLKR